MDKLLARLTKKRREKTQINKVRNEKGEVTTHITEIQKKKKSMREYYKQFYANKFDNLEETDNFLETYTLPILNQEEIDQLNRPITRNEIEYIINKKKKPPCKQKARTYDFTGEFYQTNN